MSGIATDLTFSISWKFDANHYQLSSLSLLVSIAVIRVLKFFTLADISVKWPNDILVNCKKLGGILIEGRYEDKYSYTAIIGIGINIKLPVKVRKFIAREVIDLYDLTGKSVNRNYLLGLIIDELSAILNFFEKYGFSLIKDEWIAYHFYHGKLIELILPDNTTIEGIVSDINDDGSLCLLTKSGLRSYQVGEISLRSS